MFSLLTAAIAIQAVASKLPVTEVPPPVVAVPPPIVRPLSARPIRPTMRVRVRITAGDELLLNDRFWISHQLASANQTRQEALGPNCPEARGTLNRQVQFQLMPWSDGSLGRYRAEVRWARPVLMGCEVGTRTASIEQMVQLLPGQTVVLQGDGGLRLELTRE